MRLICPNCGAQYEVDAGLVPETGRDVQCSNCGHGWFQHPEDHAAEDDDAPAGAPDALPDDEETPRRRKLDPQVADVLREEAEREAAARKAEAGSGLESQPDLGLDENDEVAADRSNAARARMARLRGLDDDAPPSPQGDGQSRGEMLPDVDEINSTLRSDEDRGESPMLTDTLPAMKKRGGGRLGFYLVLLICVIGIAVYALAPMIAEQVPALKPYLTTYVEWVTAMRMKLNGWVEAGIGKFRGLIGGGGGE